MIPADFSSSLLYLLFIQQLNIYYQFIYSQTLHFSSTLCPMFFLINHLIYRQVYINFLIILNVQLKQTQQIDLFF